MRRFYTMLLTLALTLVLSSALFAQKTVVQVPSDVTEGNLNNAVQAAIDAGTLSNTTFELEAFGYYILTGTIVVPEGEHLEIVAPEPGTTQATAPPQIVWTTSGGVTTDFNFEVLGEITLKNVWLRYADVDGVQVSSSLVFQDNPDPNAQEKGTFEGVIFDYSQISSSGSGAVDVQCDRFVGVFKNCYWRNCIDPHFRWYGRAVSFPFGDTGLGTDSLLFENCSFANMGFVLMAEAANYHDNVTFNHCTFVNVNRDVLEQGWWNRLAVTNSIFLNGYMMGAIPANDTDDPGGMMTITKVDSFGFSVAFTDQDRRILFANNSYFLDAWLVDWMANNPYSVEQRRTRMNDLIPVPRPMLNDSTKALFASDQYPFMNSANLYENDDPGFLVTPTNLDDLKQFLLNKWSDDTDIDWAYERDAGWFQTWPLPEDMSYTNETLKAAAMGGFPLGDLYHWWPDEYTQWGAQKDAEYNRINGWLDTGQDPLTVSVAQPNAGIPSVFSLSQNYPNPFNPTTQIEYSVPISGKVSLKVYNTLGQEIATLFEGIRKVGQYVATFDGAGLASGVYLYRLQAGDVSITKKFALMK